MAQRHSISIYHLHLIYDVVNFTAYANCFFKKGLRFLILNFLSSVSNFAAIICAYDDRLKGRGVRYIFIGIFGLFYAAFTIMLGIRLNQWNDRVPGQCFNASKIARPNARHPYVDQIYLGVTSFYVFSLLCSVIEGVLLGDRIPIGRESSIITISLLHFILHVYMVIALRISNHGLLKNASLEQEWGFGQILALVMLGSTVVGCARSFEGMTMDYILYFPPPHL